MGNKTSIAGYADEHSFVELTSVTITSKNRPTALAEIKLTKTNTLSELKRATPESFKEALVEPNDIYYVTVKANIKYPVKALSWAWIYHQSKSVAELADLVTSGRFTDDDYLKQNGYIVHRKIVGDLPVGKMKLVSPPRSFSQLKNLPSGQFLEVALVHDKNKVHFCDMTRISRHQGGGETGGKAHVVLVNTPSGGMGEAKATIAPSDPIFGEILRRHKKPSPTPPAPASPSPISSASHPAGNSIQSTVADKTVDQSKTPTHDDKYVKTLQVLVVVEFVVILLFLLVIMYQGGQTDTMQVAGVPKVEL
eukprot:comp86564_c0_seq1/m.48481 comp86564_c0_seq1/g.48481  ORF comp86564_c0_seq1/g.48481 comp86564_c0_seq1/m.48481 type:complete len:308 (-) comp86564_c0_seq1:489-1412(-)